MKIAIISSSHVPSTYAHSINTVKHAAAFSKLGYDVELLCVKRYKEEKELKKIKNIYDLYGIESIKIKFFKDKSFFYYQEAGFLGKCLRAFNKFTFGVFKNFFDPEEEISNYIKRNNFNLCYGRSYRIVNYNIKNKIPSIIETHAANPFNIKEIKDFIRNSQSPYFQGIVTIHEKLKKNFVKMGMPEEKVLVYEDAVDLDLFDKVEDDKITNRQKLKLPANKKIILYSGSLKKGKGIHIILDIAKSFNSNKNILFVLVGGSPLEIENWKKYYNKDNVLFKGFQNGKLIPQYLKSADILIMPYDLEDKNMVMDINTTSPIKLFEYMASKRPIISTKIEVIEKLLDDKKDIMLGNSLNEYIINIEKLLSENSINLTTNAYNKVQQFTYKNRCNKIINDLYNNI